MGALEQQFQDCLARGHIKVFADAVKLADKQLAIAKSDLSEANDGLGRARWKWSTIQAYYAMFHVARALLYTKGFRERHHRCLRIGVAFLYDSEGEEFRRLIADFHLAKQLRENADYENEFSENGARKIVSSAERFLQLAEKLLKQ